MPWRPLSVCRCQKQEADSSVTCQEFHTHHKTAHAIISPGKWGSWRVSCHSYELSSIMFIKLFYETFYWEQDSHGVVNQNLSDDLCIHKVTVGYAVIQHTGWFFKPVALWENAFVLTFKSGWRQAIELSSDNLFCVSYDKLERLPPQPHS